MKSQLRVALVTAAASLVGCGGDAPSKSPSPVASSPIEKQSEPEIKLENAKLPATPILDEDLKFIQSVRALLTPEELEAEDEHHDIERWLAKCKEVLPPGPQFSYRFKNCEELSFDGKYSWNSPRSMVAYKATTRFAEMRKADSVTLPKFEDAALLEPASSSLGQSLYDYTGSENIRPEQAAVCLRMAADPEAKESYINKYNLDEKVTAAAISCGQRVLSRLEQIKAKVGDSLLPAWNYIHVCDITGAPANSSLYISKEAFEIMGLSIVQALSTQGPGDYEYVVGATPAAKEKALAEKIKREQFISGLKAILTPSAEELSANRKIIELSVKLGLNSEADIKDATRVLNTLQLADQLVPHQERKGLVSSYLVAKDQAPLAEHQADILAFQELILKTSREMVKHFEGAPVAYELISNFASEKLAIAAAPEERKAKLAALFNFLVLSNYGPGEIYEFPFAGEPKKLELRGTLFAEDLTMVAAWQEKVSEATSPDILVIPSLSSARLAGLSLGTVSHALEAIDRITSQPESELSKSDQALRPIAIQFKPIIAALEGKDVSKLSLGALSERVYNALSKQTDAKGNPWISGSIYEHDNLAIVLQISRMLSRPTKR